MELPTRVYGNVKTNDSWEPQIFADLRLQAASDEISARPKSFLSLPEIGG